ncbi:MAG TPA: hypothetical protein VF610_03810 [Segetibacter sp.]|jgi:hypothetical protein
MKTKFSLANLVFVLAFIATVIGFSAFSQQQKDERYSFRKEDSSKQNGSAQSGKRYRYESGGDLDKLDLAMKQIDLEMKKLEVEMKKLTINQELLVKQFDGDKISQQINESINSMDWDKINDDIEQSVKSTSRAEVAKVKAEMQKVKSELQKQKVNIVKLDSEKIKQDVQSAMKNAKESMMKAKEEIKNLQEFTEALEKDGLIDKKKGYKIEVKEGQLYINEQKQSKEVSDKYRKYYKKENFSLDMSEGDSFEI